VGRSGCSAKSTTTRGIDAGEGGFLAEWAHSTTPRPLSSPCINSNGSRGWRCSWPRAAAGGRPWPKTAQRGPAEASQSRPWIGQGPKQLRVAARALLPLRPGTGCALCGWLKMRRLAVDAGEQAGISPRAGPAQLVQVAVSPGLILKGWRNLVSASYPPRDYAAGGGQVIAAPRLHQVTLWLNSTGRA